MQVEHVLVVNGSKSEPIDLLRQDPALRLSVITEPAHRHLYPGVQYLALVDDIENLSAVRDAALEVCTRQGLVDHVVAASERALPTGAYLRSYLGLSGMPFDVANLFCNKYAMKQKLREAGIPTASATLAPTVADMDEAIRRTNLPAVVKPAFGNGAAFTHVLTDRQDVGGVMADRLHGLLDGAPGPFVVEEFMDVAEEYHCDATIVDGQAVFAAVSRYFKPVLQCFDTLFGSHTLPDDSPDTLAVQELNQRVVTALGLRDGVTHLEALRTPDGLYLLGEIACRPGGGGIPQMLQNKFDIDTRRLFLSAALGRRLDASVRTTDGVSWWCGLPLRHGRVLEVSTAKDFLDIPGVRHAEMFVTPGDTVQGTLYSTTRAGLLTGLVDSVPDLLPMLSEIEKRYALDTE